MFDTVKWDGLILLKTEVNLWTLANIQIKFQIL
jgi:hypothetical protein